MYYKKPQAGDPQLYWWESQNADMSEWRKNYMRTLELRTLNAKRVLKLNVKSDVEKANQEAQQVL